MNDSIVSLNDRIKSLESDLNEINEQVSYLKEQSNSQIGMLDTAFDGVSSQLGASSNFIAIFAIIIGIISVALGIYVSRIESKIRAIAQDNETLLLRNVQIRQDIESLSNKITSDTKGLYNILRREESNHIIERLLLVPDDIVNLNTLLLSRELEGSHFEKVKEAFVRSDDDHKDPYDTLFFQHFAGQSMLDVEIKNRILNSLDILIANSFKNDIIKSTIDYFDHVHSNGIIASKDEVNKFAIALSKSKYNKFDELYVSVINQMTSREEKFQLYDVIEKTDLSKQFRIGYGKILLDYKGDELSAFEKGIINEIESII